MLHIRVTLEIAGGMTEGLEILDREVAAQCECRVETRCAVSLGEDHTVSAGCLRVLRIDVHFFKIEVCQNVGDGEGSAGMTALCGVNRVNDADSDLTGNLTKLVFSLLVHKMTVTVFYNRAFHCDF